MHGSNLFVKNISNSVSIQNLIDLFSIYGEVKNVKIIKDRRFAFVEMSRQMDAENAIKSLNGTEFEGSVLRVNEAHSRKKRRR